MLEYAGIRVRDLARARAFYCDGLGLRFVAAGRMAAGGQWEELEDPQSHQRLELNFYPDGPAYREGDELDHLGFAVENVDESIDRLVALGAKVRIRPFTDAGVRLAFLADPDGVWIELSQSLRSDDPPSSRRMD